MNNNFIKNINNSSVNKTHISSNVMYIYEHLVVMYSTVLEELTQFITQSRLVLLNPVVYTVIVNAAGETGEDLTGLILFWVLALDCIIGFL